MHFGGVHLVGAHVLLVANVSLIELNVIDHWIEALVERIFSGFGVKTGEVMK